MELHRRRYMSVQHQRHHLTQDFYKPYALGVSIPLWDHNRSLPGTLLNKVNPKEGDLDYPNQLLPLCEVGILLPRFFL